MDGLVGLDHIQVRGSGWGLTGYEDHAMEETPGCDLGVLLARNQLSIWFLNCKHDLRKKNTRQKLSFPKYGNVGSENHPTQITNRFTQAYSQTALPPFLHHSRTLWIDCE